MTKEEILKIYEVKDGRIVSPGKFEGERIYVPYFYDAAMDGFSDIDKDGNFVIEIEDFDVEGFPEIEEDRGDNTAIKLTEDDQGFVHAEFIKEY